MKGRLIEKIREICSADIYEIGFASLSGLLSSEWSGYSYGISLVRKLEEPIIDEIKTGPTLEYFRHYHEINNELNKKTDEIVSLLTQNRIEAIGVKATLKDSELGDDYKKTLRYSFSHKMVATRAGLGWIGKTDLLISKRFGPRIRLASILTTAKIRETGEPVNKSLCGACNLCVEKCPVGAATGALWEIGIDRDTFYNPFTCRQFAREISARNIKKEISLCGICVSVCPRGRG